MAKVSWTFCCFKSMICVLTPVQYLIKDHVQATVTTFFPIAISFLKIGELSFDFFFLTLQA